MQKDNLFLSVKEYPLWLCIVLPAITMLLGWGLRGFIGGGPFGAMIPGAMVMLTICMMLNIPVTIAAVAVVFGTAGIGMGGEMTYGQTLGFLRNPATVWWGTCGTTVKGGVWGLVGGVFIGLGLIHRKIKTKKMVTGFLLFLFGFIVGLKLINDPKVIYFSDPVNKPRQESWAGLLFAATALLTYLKVTTERSAFRVVFRFAIYGLIGGALGFGLGGFWLVLGSHLSKDSWISEWWKLMEFSFGCIMGGFFGYAAWLSRYELKFNYDRNTTRFINGSFIEQFFIVTLTGVTIYLLLPLIAPFVEARSDANSAGMAVFRTIARILVSYTFMGSLLVMVALRWPFAAFQIAVTLTFSHTVIDLVDDLAAKHILLFTPLFSRSIILLASAAISLMVALFQRSQIVLKSMFQILVWSTVAIAIIRMILYAQFQKAIGDSFLKFVIGDMLVFDVFVSAAIVVSLLTIRRIANNSVA